MSEISQLCVLSCKVLIISFTQLHLSRFRPVNFFPLEAVKTNVIGTDNVLTAAIDAGVKRVVCLSTDKAAYPINAMGTSKAMMEKNHYCQSEKC